MPGSREQAGPLWQRVGRRSLWLRQCVAPAGGGDGQAAADRDELLLGHQAAGGGEHDCVAGLLELVTCPPLRYQFLS